jgi:hypothetical protein
MENGIWFSSHISYLVQMIREIIDKKQQHATRGVVN